MTERRTSLLAAMLVAIGPVSMALYTPAMPELVRAFGTTEAAVKTTLTVYFAGFAVAQLVAGPASDAFGRRRASIAFLLIYLIGAITAAFAVSIGMLIIGRLIQGIGAAIGVTVARAIVRDQFVGESASRIMNTVAIMLGVAPAMSPAIGGFTLSVAGWQAIFYVMIGFGVVSCVVIFLAMAETTLPSRQHARPGRIVNAYGRVLRNGEFLSASLVIGFAVGALYAQATMLPFVLIDAVGLSPTQFGFSMLMQSGSFFSGSVTMRLLMRRYSAERLVLPGLLFIASGSVLLLVCLGLFGPSFLSVMLPIAFAAFGIAFVMPHMQVAGLVPFPQIAGSASAMMGFIQMSAGLVGGAVAALIGDPVQAIAIIVPTMAAGAVVSYVWYRRRRLLQRQDLEQESPPAE